MQEYIVLLPLAMIDTLAPKINVFIETWRRSEQNLLLV